MSFYISFTSLCIRAFFCGGPSMEIRDFLFGDSRKPSFARHLRRVVAGRDECLRQLEEAWSRKNGFGHIPLPEEPDTEDPHWVYASPESDLWLQAHNCPRCGNYIWSDTMGNFGLDSRLVCVCA